MKISVKPTAKRAAAIMALVFMAVAAAMAQCQVTVITETIDHARKSILLYQTVILVRSFRTIDKVHYCLFEIPDGVICHYRRRIETTPGRNEGKFFRMDNGEYVELADGTEPFEYINCFLSDYITKWHYQCGMMAAPTNWQALEPKRHGL